MYNCLSRCPSMVLVITLSLCWGAHAHANVIDIDDLRARLVTQLNLGNSIIAVVDTGEVAKIEQTFPLGSSLAAKVGGTLAAAYAGGKVGGMIGAAFGPKGATVGCAIGAACGGGAYAAASIADNSKDPLVVDIFWVDSMIVAGDGEIIPDLLELAALHIVLSRDIWQPSDYSLSFVDPDVFDVVLKDDNGSILTDILGTDALVLNTPDGPLLGFAAYNDIHLTGRAVTATDEFGFDLSAVTSQPVGTEVTTFGTFMVVAEPVPSPSTLACAILGICLVVLTRPSAFCTSESSMGSAT